MTTVDGEKDREVGQKKNCEMNEDEIMEIPQPDLSERVRNTLG